MKQPSERSLKLAHKVCAQYVVMRHPDGKQIRDDVAHLLDSERRAAARNGVRVGTQMTPESYFDKKVIDKAVEVALDLRLTEGTEDGR